MIRVKYTRHHSRFKCAIDCICAICILARMKCTHICVLQMGTCALQAMIFARISNWSLTRTGTTRARRPLVASVENGHFHFCKYLKCFLLLHFCSFVECTCSMFMCCKNVWRLGSVNFFVGLCDGLVWVLCKCASVEAAVTGA